MKRFFLTVLFAVVVIGGYLVCLKLLSDAQIYRSEAQTEREVCQELRKEVERLKTLLNESHAVNDLAIEVSERTYQLLTGE